MNTLYARLSPHKWPKAQKKNKKKYSFKKIIAMF